METQAVTSTLPIWILVTFCFLVSGIILLVFSRGDLKKTVYILGVAGLILLGIAGTQALNTFLQAHFLGQFDKLGIPYREAGPGWEMVMHAWTLWAVPTFAGIIVTGVVAYLIHAHILKTSSEITHYSSHFEPTFHPVPTEENAEPQIIEEPSLTKTANNIKHKLEVEALKQEASLATQKLISAIKITEEALEKNQDYEIEIELLKREKTEYQNELEQQIASLQIELEQLKEVNENLAVIAYNKIKNNLE